MKKILSFILAATAVASGMTSCTDFLTEENKSGSTADLAYSTKSGIDGLVTAMYAYGRGYWGKEGALGLTEGGTDLFYYGGDPKQKSLCSYDITSACPGFTSAGQNDSHCLDQYWEYMYAGVDVCNNVILYVPQNKVIQDDVKNSYMGEAYFMRSLLYLQMVSTWGPIPYNEEPISQPKDAPTRMPEAEVYKNILQSLEKSMSYFEKSGKKVQADASGDGHATYYSAEALYARVALYAASWLGKDAVEGYSNLYQTACNAAVDVIKNSGATLYARTTDTWNLNNEAYNKNKENLFAVYYSDDVADIANGIPYRYSAENLTSPYTHDTYNNLLCRQSYNKGGGNTQFAMFVSKWDNSNVKDMGAGGSSTANTSCFVRVKAANTSTVQSSMTGKNIDIAKYYSPYSLGYRRWLPSLYLWNELNKIKDTDQRYNATILDTYRMPYELTQNCKNSKGNLLYPNMSDQDVDNEGIMSYAEAYTQDGNYFNGGYIGIKYVCMDGNSSEGQALQARAKDRYRIQFAYNGDIPIYTSGDPATALPTSKGKTTSDVYGDARYTHAEIGGLSSYPAIKKFLDDQFSTSNYSCSTVFSSRDCIVLRLAEMYLILAEAEMNGATQTVDGNLDTAEKAINSLRGVRAITGKDNSLSAVYGSSNVDIDVILRERALELCGEYQRWFDLKRTHKLLEYVKARNAQGSGNIALKHYYRPIPSTEFQSVTNASTEAPSQNANGVMQYSAASANFWQNPGYDY